MTGPDKGEFHKPLVVEKVLGPKQLDLYYDLLNARRRELIKEGASSKNVSEEEKREIINRIKGMSLEEFQRTTQEIERNKLEMPAKEQSQYKGLPKPVEPTVADYKRFNQQRGGFNADLTVKDD